MNSTAAKIALFLLVSSGMAGAQLRPNLDIKWPLCSGSATVYNIVAGTCVVNGVSVPTSAALLASNSSNQIIPAPAANVATLLASLTGCSTAAYAYVPKDGACEPMGGGGSISGLTTGKYPIATSSTAIGDGHIDEITNPGSVTVTGQLNSQADTYDQINAIATSGSTSIGVGIVAINDGTPADDVAQIGASNYVGGAEIPVSFGLNNEIYIYPAVGGSDFPGSCPGCVGFNTETPAYSIDNYGYGGAPGTFNAGGAGGGYAINGAAPSRHLLCGNGTLYVDCVLAGTDMPSSAVQNSQANTYGAGLQDFSGATVKLPSSYAVGSSTINQPASAGTLALTSQLPATLAAVAHNFFTAYNASTGTYTAARPVCADLSDSASGCSTAAYSLPAATSSTLGGVKPDGTSIQNSSGAISAATATNGQVALSSANVTMTSTSGTFYDGPTTGSLVAGTYLITSTLTIGKASATTQAVAECKLWDGTTLLTSGEVTLSYVSSAAATYATITLSAVGTNASSDTYKVSCRPSVANEVIYYQTPTNTLASASTISYVRLK